MRGIFSSGVLDVFHEKNFYPFALAIGSSAGGCNLASYLAGQHDRNRRCYADFMARREFLSGGRFLRGGHWLDLDWLWETFERAHPLDVEAIAASPVRFVVAATSVDTGAPVYMAPTRAEVLPALKGSCAIPILYRSVIRHGDCRLADGGVAAPIPAQEAYRRGARHLLVIRSRPAAFVKRPGLGTRAGAWLLRDTPALAEAFRRGPETYAAAVSFLQQPPSDCSVVQIAPPTPLRTGRVSRDLAALAHDYAVGRQMGLEAIAAWEAGDVHHRGPGARGVATEGRAERGDGGGRYDLRRHS